jgi:hypothetical protein
MVVDIDGFVSVRLQQDHGSIVTIESKTDLDRNLQSLSERGSEPSDRKLIPVSRQIYRCCEGDKSSGIGTLKCPIHSTTKTPKSRYAISRFDRNR